MPKEENDLYRAKIGKLTIRGGINPKDEPSIILGMPQVDKKRYIILKIDGKEELTAIMECILEVIERR